MSNPALTLEEAWRLRPDTYAEVIGNGRFIPYNWITYVLQQIFEAVVIGDARIIVNAPPQHGKSQSISHWLPTWYLDTWPERSVILASYGDTFASRWGLQVRDEFQAQQGTFTEIKQERALASDWMTTRGGGMRSVGIGGSLTGIGSDLLIIDDPHKNWEEALSPTMREKVVDWFNAVLYTRRRPGASIIVVQTRWHERDLTGYLIAEHEDDWRLISLPAIAEDNDELGRRPGEALCPERYPIDQLEKIRLAIGSQMFAGLYQQRPAPLEGGMVKREWFHYYQDRPQCERYLQAWDLTYKATGTSYVVGQLWGVKQADFYLLDQVRGKFSFTETLQAIKSFSELYPWAIEKVIEDAANGAAVVDTLKSEIPGVIAIRPTSSKEARLTSVSALIESGHVWLPSSAPWVQDFVEEVVTFPNAANDDQVDTMTLALARLSQKEKACITNFTIPEMGIRASPWREING